MSVESILAALKADIAKGFARLEGLIGKEAAAAPAQVAIAEAVEAATGNVALIPETGVAGAAVEAVGAAAAAPTAPNVAAAVSAVTTATK